VQNEALPTSAVGRTTNLGLFLLKPFMKLQQVRLRMAARTLPQLPAIYQRRAASSRDIAKELGVSVPDWANVRRNRSVGSAHRRLMVEPIIEKVCLDSTLGASSAVCSVLLTAPSLAVRLPHSAPPAQSAMQADGLGACRRAAQHCCTGTHCR
jgi:hypothetical protein